jgi:glutathione synthase/RimK-type ligase-like ATP-grasp enzyme
MILTYSAASQPSALKLAGNGITLNRGSEGTINWGRNRANTLLNPDISNSTNKRRMRELFESHGVPMPRLIDAPLYAVDQGTVIVGRPDRHTRGRGLWRCETRSDVLRAVKGTSLKKPATHFMEWIEAPHEYRVHIFNGNSIRISEKDTNRPRVRDVVVHRDNVTLRVEYSTIKPTGRVWHVRKAAKQAVNALGLDFGCVDILATDRECWVLEVNAAPGLGGSLPRLYADTFNTWYRTYSQ